MKKCNFLLYLVHIANTKNTSILSDNIHFLVICITFIQDVPVVSLIFFKLKC